MHKAATTKAKTNLFANSFASLAIQPKKDNDALYHPEQPKPHSTQRLDNPQPRTHLSLALRCGIWDYYRDCEASETR
jgi:hypothetical protein